MGPRSRGPPTHWAARAESPPRARPGPACGPHRGAAGPGLRTLRVWKRAPAIKTVSRERGGEGRAVPLGRVLEGVLWGETASTLTRKRLAEWRPDQAETYKNALLEDERRTNVQRGPQATRRLSGRRLRPAQAPCSKIPPPTPVHSRTTPRSHACAGPTGHTGFPILQVLAARHPAMPKDPLDWEAPTLLLPLPSLPWASRYAVTGPDAGGLLPQSPERPRSRDLCALAFGLSPLVVALCRSQGSRVP